MRLGYSLHTHKDYNQDIHVPTDQSVGTAREWGRNSSHHIIKGQPRLVIALMPGEFIIVVIGVRRVGTSPRHG